MSLMHRRQQHEAEAARRPYLLNDAIERFPIESDEDSDTFSRPLIDNSIGID